MADFIDKLNVLVKASLNNFLGSSHPTDPSASSSRPNVSPERLGKDIDKEIAALRKRIDDALSQEDAMQKRLDQLQHAARACGGGHGKCAVRIDP